MTEYKMKTHDDIVDNLIEQLTYLDTLPDFNESCTTLYIFEAIQTIKAQRAQLLRDKQFATEAMQANQQQLTDLELLELAEKREAVSMNLISPRP